MLSAIRTRSMALERKKIIMFENVMETSKVNEISYVNCETLVIIPNLQCKYKNSITFKDKK